MVKNTTSQQFIVVSGDPISERAYEIYLERGGADGSDWEDWFRAERELHAMRTKPRKRASVPRNGETSPGSRTPDPVRPPI